MLDIVRSREAMVMATVAAVLWALGSALGGLAYAVFNPSGNFTTSNNLITASAWLIFVSGLVALGAVCFVAWHLFVTRQWTRMWEANAAALATLIFVIGLLIAATQATDVSTAADVVAAVGVGGWCALVVVGAARRALLEQETAVAQHQAPIRLGGAASVLLLAIAIGLPNASLEDATLAVTNAAIFAIAFAGLVVVLAIARGRRFIITRRFVVLAVGLWTLAAAGVVRAVCDGIVFGPPPHSVLSIRLGLSVPSFVEAGAFLILAWAALGRVAELTVRIPTTGPGTGVTMPPPAPGTVAFPPEPSTAAAVPPSWQPDPGGRHQLRWWDGARWTEHVMDGDQPSVDPPL